MKQYTLLIIFILVGSGVITLKAQDINGNVLIPWNSKKDTTTEVKNTRSENIELIDKLIKQVQELGKLNGNPIINIENITLSYKEYKSVRDTISILGEYKIKSISVYSESCSKEVLSLLEKSGESQVLEIKMDNTP